MNTESTENIRGYVFYDDECRFCRGAVRLANRAMMRWGYHFVPMQAEWALKTLGVRSPDDLNEMKLVTGDGRTFGGVDAFREVATHTVVMYPFFILLEVPGMMTVARRLYRFIAENRYHLAKPASQTVDRDGYVKRVFLNVP